MAKKSKQNGKTVAKKNGYSDLTFQGWRRENGRVGVRNHVIILPLDDLSNAACEAVANNIKATMALPHAYGRLQFGEDLDLHCRTLIGTGANPNVAAVIVIGIEDQWTKRVVDGIAATGKPVTGFGIELHGDHDTIMRASKVAKEYVQWASEKVREECALAGKEELFEKLNSHLSATNETAVPYDQLSVQLGRPAATLRSDVARLRSRYRAILREEVGGTVADASEVDAELRHLCEVLAAD